MSSMMTHCSTYLIYIAHFLGQGEYDFDHFRAQEDSWDQGRWWYKLAHVCQRWRNLILGSASYLDLSLLCTNGITAEDEEGMILALRQRHRVRHLRLFFPFP